MRPRMAPRDQNRNRE